MSGAVGMVRCQRCRAERAAGVPACPICPLARVDSGRIEFKERSAQQAKRDPKRGAK
jgi:hypothetical protein